MINGSDDEALIGERFGRIAMADKVATPAGEMTRSGSLSPLMGLSLAPAAWYCRS
jgi:hypothetical protein